MTVEYTATNISTKTLEFNNGQIEGVPKNPRTITQKDYDDLKNSIKQSGIYGFKAPIVYKTDDRYIVLGGNMRLKACKELNILEIPIFLLADDTPVEELMKIAIQDNISNGAWDYDLLANEWPQDQLEEWGLDTTQGWDTKKELPDDIDETPELPKTPISKLGDLWMLGQHRVLCGDSTDKVTVERLMDGKKADMVFTDPPYGISLVKDGKVGADFGVAKKGQYTPVINDETTDTAQQNYMLTEQFCNKHIIWGGNYFTDFLPFSDGWLIWDKRGDSGIRNTFADGEMAWCSFHTPIRIYTQLWNGMIREGEKDKRLHPTQKPLKMLSAIIDDFTKKSEVILDSFLGSGSTLIACEQTDRTCYGLELDPQYVDVICKRWQTLTGQLPILESTGEAHDFCS